MPRLSVSVLLLAVVFIAVIKAEDKTIVYPQDPSFPLEAQVVLKAASGANPQGVITLLQSKNGGPVTITGHITGLTPGYHGFHIHEKGDTSDECKAAGGHFNPFQQPHGAPNDVHRHAGDLGSIWADEAGAANFEIIDHQICLIGGETLVTGRAIVLHEKADDFGKGGNEESLKTGNAGKRLACGVIFFPRNKK